MHSREPSLPGNSHPSDPSPQLQRSPWQGRQLIAPKWIELSLRPAHDAAPNSGLLWWRIASRTRYHIDQAHLDALAATGVDAAFIAKLRGLTGVHEDDDAYLALRKAVFGDDWSNAIREDLAPA